jgi:hypothetical protein
LGGAIMSVQSGDGSRKDWKAGMPGPEVVLNSSPIFNEEPLFPARSDGRDQSW